MLGVDSAGVSRVRAKGEFLLVEDDAAIARAVGRLLEKVRPTRHVTGVTAAKIALATRGKWTGLVVDIGLPDGSGLDVVGVARQRWPSLPALVLTGSTQPADINRSFTLRADFLVKPGSPEAIKAFARKAIARESIDDERVADVVDQIVVEVGLTTRERDVLLVAIEDVGRSGVAHALGVRENTAKTHVRTLLKKTAAGSLEDLANRIYRRALAGASAETTKRVVDDE